MATNVTVLGAADGTITIPLTSAANAAVAQTALTGISMAVAAGTLTPVDATGSTTIPAAGTGDIAVIDQTGSNAVPLVIGYSSIAAVLDGTASETVVTGVDPNETVISGVAGADVDNLGSNTQVFFGGGNNSFTAVGSPALDFAPTAQVWLDGNGTFDVSFGATTIFAGGGAALNVLNTGAASNTIDLGQGDESNTVVLSGGTETAATVNAAGAALSVLQNGGAGIINANESNVTIYGIPPTGDGSWSDDGSVTLFGGSGTDLVTDGTGLFEAGNGGGSLLSSTTLAGAATLVGGGPGDTLQALGVGDLMVAGSGNESLLGGTAPVVAVGYRGGAGAATDMIGGADGGNVFFIGDGATSVTGNHGAGGANVYVELVGGANTATIADFVSGTGAAGVPVANSDFISLAMPGGGAYQLVPGAGDSVAANQVGYSTVAIGGDLATEVQFGDGATWTLYNVVLHPGDFV